MKALFSILFFLSLLLSVSAQAPSKMSFQAVIRKDSDELVENRQVSMRISILQGSANGLLVYSETHRPTTNENGLVSLEIGGGSVMTGNFSSIPWSAGPYFIKTETDVKGGRNYNIIGTSQLLSVPYALYAEKAGTTTAGTIKNQIMYWTGASWSTVNPGVNGQVLTLCKGELVWTVDGKCPGTVDSLNCGEVSISGTLKRNIYNDSVFVNLSYTGGDKGYYPAMTIASTGVKGFKAVLKAGQFNEGDGNLLFKISGASSETGNATFEINVGNKSCSVSVAVKQLLSSPQVQAVGSLYQGGVIAYVFKPGDPGYNLNIPRYLIVAPTDAFETASLKSKFQWGCNGTAITGADGTALLTGSQNTVDLEAACTTTGTAADYCANLVLNGYDDWFLPSREELVKIWMNRDLIGGFSNASGYWSSSETINPSYAWNVDFSTGLPFSHGKGNQYNVRPVRYSSMPLTSSNCPLSDIHNPEKTYGTLVDQQGNKYKTIAIGSQEWMAENLNTSVYRNGDPISYAGIYSYQWKNTTEGAWCFPVDSITNLCAYGKIYNLQSLNDPRNLCPTGWHLPSPQEWGTLFDFLGGNEIAEGKLMSTSRQYWKTPFPGANNESGFSGLPAGIHMPQDFREDKYVGNSLLWGTTEYMSRVFIESTPQFGMDYWTDILQGGVQWRMINFGFSVRCVKD